MLTRFTRFGLPKSNLPSPSHASNLVASFALALTMVSLMSTGNIFAQPAAQEPKLAPQPDTSMTIEYPKSKAVEQSDDYHGTKIDDPFRWL